jgi:hypothetical protein
LLLVLFFLLYIQVVHLLKAQELLIKGIDISANIDFRNFGRSIQKVNLLDFTLSHLKSLFNHFFLISYKIDQLLKA